mgnify:CR=1 FL=1
MALPLIIGAGVGIAILSSGKKRPKVTPPASPTPYPWMSQHVNIAINQAIRNGFESAEEIATWACRETYPLTPRGNPAVWNHKTRSQGRHEKICWMRCLARVQHILARSADLAINGED